MNSIEDWINALRRSKKLGATSEVIFQWNLLSNRAGYRNFGYVISEKLRVACVFNNDTYFDAYQKCSNELWSRGAFSRAFVLDEYMYVVVLSHNDIDDRIYDILTNTLKCECDGQLVDRYILSRKELIDIEKVLGTKFKYNMLFFRFRMLLIQDLPIDSFGSRLLRKTTLALSRPALLSDLRSAFPFEDCLGIGDFIPDPNTNWWISIQMQKYHLVERAKAAFTKLTDQISNELSGDFVEEQLWQSCFSLLVGEDIIHSKSNRSTHEEQRQTRIKKVFDLQFGDEVARTCCLCGENIDMGDAFDEGHILPAAWGNKKDKYWWNMMPLHGKCNKTQSSVSMHLIVALQKQGQIAVARRICKNIMIECLRSNVISLGVVGNKTLIGFVRGFFLVAEEDFEPTTDWATFLLSEEEISEISELIDCKTFET